MASQRGNGFGADPHQRIGRYGVAGGRLLGGCIIGVALAGCQNQECEAARLELAQTWETLRNTATSRKQIPEGADLSKADEDTRIRVWTDIEQEAELLRSSFQTPQVTWASADKARADIGRSFKPLEANSDPMTRGFALTLNDADKRLEHFRQTCR